MYILILATIGLLVFWLVEYMRHSKNVSGIPHRIHVNGTRGKSSVTRLIGAGLRAGGVKTIAKTTGTMPRLIMEDGTEASIERLFGANIIEQKYVFRYAAKHKPDAMVIECMAVNPLYQWITERRFVKSTISVITNARMDHIDLMGDTLDSITKCLCNTIPQKGICLTSEEKQFGVMKAVADKRNTEIMCVKPDKITLEDLDGFSYIEHADNIALALEVCKRLGVDRKTALKGMQEANPDPGALKKYRVEEKGKVMEFYNVFAANDPNSTHMIYELIAGRLDNQQKMIMLNTRSDRFFRSEQLAEVCADLDFDYLILTGERTGQLKQFAIGLGIPAAKIVELPNHMAAEKVYNNVLDITKKESHIVGIGNIAGKIKYGAQIVKYFKAKSEGGARG